MIITSTPGNDPVKIVKLKMYKEPIL
jgi:hypothetical protein